MGEVVVAEEEVAGASEVTEAEGVSLKDLSAKLNESAKARDWEKYHSPRNLLLAKVGEVGELSEIFQWRGEVERGLQDWEESHKEHLSEELSDVLLFQVRLADVCGIDLGDAAVRKIVKNGIKYPPTKLYESICLCLSHRKTYVLSKHTNESSKLLVYKH